MGYRASDLTQVAVFNTSTAASAAGIWQSGAGLVGAPDGSIYFMTGNESSIFPAAAYPVASAIWVTAWFGYR